MLNAAIIVIDVIAAFALIALILLHSGKGSGLSDMFGGHRAGAPAGQDHGRRRHRLRALHVLAQLEVVLSRRAAPPW